MYNLILSFLSLLLGQDGAMDDECDFAILHSSSCPAVHWGSPFASLNNQTFNLKKSSPISFGLISNTFGEQIRMISSGLNGILLFILADSVDSFILIALQNRLRVPYFSVILPSSLLKLKITRCTSSLFHVAYVVGKF